MRNRTSRITEIMEKMFSYVGVPYSEDFCQEDGWYLKHTWTQQQEESFKDWLIGYIKNNDKTTIKKAAKEAEMLIFYCGWKRR